MEMGGGGGGFFVGGGGGVIFFTKFGHHIEFSSNQRMVSVLHKA